MNPYDTLLKLKGIGEKTMRVFEKVEIFNIGDLLSYYPRTYYRYEDLQKISELREDQTIAVRAQILRAPSVQYIKKLQIVSTVIADETGELEVRWYNMPYLKATLQKGTSFIFHGRIRRKGARIFLEQPGMYTSEKYEEMRKELQPVYVLTKGLTNLTVSKAVRQALDGCTQLEDVLPEEVRERHHLAELRYSMEEIHFPRDEHHLLLARRRLVFDEFFWFLLAIRRYKDSQAAAGNAFSFQSDDLVDSVPKKLPYQLTGAQQRTWEQIKKDMRGEQTMNRLVQGDVGSGKTIVAFLAMLFAAENGLQSSLMVPTEVLARQHFEAVSELLEEQQIKEIHPILLTGSMTAKEKRLAREKISSGEADLIIGTHALIQEKVEYQRLGLVVTDEQHRFGVKQREALSDKGGNWPHTLVMSATPIPRTLAVILYGDLDISVMDELPANRIPIKNCVVDTGYRGKAYRFIEGQVRQGRQAYVICPMVEESEMMEAEDVLSYTKKLKEVFPEDIHIAYLHGKMKPKEKNEIMERFLRNEIQVLVSTTVVEVGVNVPNATVMMIENAERFGLAQLHQLRGRVGRGGWQSYCILISGNDSKKTRERLDILNRSNDGFYIASEDLKLRGPGDLLGVRQSGDMEFRIADVFTDAAVLQEASEEVDLLLKTDPELTASGHEKLHKKLDEYLANELKKLSL
ncbi:MAG: ATP-dependent DNA helicase RecG [Eubacteriales bacterium]|nr:ATP-dependent DNA helicase RecG [Eubacteriales bacterium]